MPAIMPTIMPTIMLTIMMPTITPIIMPTIMPTIIPTIIPTIMPSIILIGHLIHLIHRFEVGALTTRAPQRLAKRKFEFFSNFGPEVRKKFRFSFCQALIYPNG